MPLGTFDRTPPPFFRQGYSALTKLVFFASLALFLMVADTRLQLVEPLRAGLATVLHPIQTALLVPLQIVQGGGTYLRGLSTALAEADAARKELVRQAERSARVEQLAAENAGLRALLDLKPALTVRSMAAEVLYEAADPFSRKLLVDRGTTHGVALASPVITEAGVIGQVTRTYPLSSEVTLLADKDFAIPVLNPRTLQRSVAFGGVGDKAMELRFMAAHADVQPGDLLLTSGVDGVYPPGLQVARVTNVERRAEGGFAQIMLAPMAAAEGVRHVLLLEPLSAQMPGRLEQEAARPRQDETVAAGEAPVRAAPHEPVPAARAAQDEATPGGASPPKAKAPEAKGGDPKAGTSLPKAKAGDATVRAGVARAGAGEPKAGAAKARAVKAGAVKAGAGKADAAKADAAKPASGPNAKAASRPKPSAANAGKPADRTTPAAAAPPATGTGPAARAAKAG